MAEESSSCSSLLVEECNLLAQQDECDCMSEIFPDEFTLHQSESPISYSIRIQPRLIIHQEVVVDRPSDASSLWPVDYPDLALLVTYPPTYPDHSSPLFSIVNGRLHTVQEQSLLRTIKVTAREEMGMPCVLSCVYAAREFFESGGLAQACIALLSDDTLSLILSYLATSKLSIQNVIKALPIFAAVEKSDNVWKTICRTRWSMKWGFERRWEHALNDYSQQFGVSRSMSVAGAFQSRKNKPYRCYNFWYERYHSEESDSKRDRISIAELCSITFECRQWFSMRDFRRQPSHMRDVLPTGLRESFCSGVQFKENGEVHDPQRQLLGLTWQSVKEENKIRLLNRRSGFDEMYTIHRLSTWGWQLWGYQYVFRSLFYDDYEQMNILSTHFTGIWSDYTSTIVLQDKPLWVRTTRGPYNYAYPYNCREVPNDEDIQNLLEW